MNVFNRLTTTKNLCDQISRLDNAIPIIIDNNSDYGPLLDWYDECKYEIIRLRENLGHHAPWKCGIVDQDDSKLYGVTDCDLDISGVPVDLITFLSLPLSWSGVIKSGMSLRIDDLPEWQNEVVEWERQWWNRPVHNGTYYYALIDTTFAIYNRETPKNIATSVGSKAVRSGHPYVARHMPWYLDAENLDEENKHYFRSANSSNSWKPFGKTLSHSKGR